MNNNTALRSLKETVLTACIDALAASDYPGCKPAELNAACFTAIWELSHWPNLPAIRKRVLKTSTFDPDIFVALVSNKLQSFVEGYEQPSIIKEIRMNLNEALSQVQADLMRSGVQND